MIHMMRAPSGEARPIPFCDHCKKPILDRGVVQWFEPNDEGGVQFVGEPSFYHAGDCAMSVDWRSVTDVHLMSWTLDQFAHYLRQIVKPE